MKRYLIIIFSICSFLGLLNSPAYPDQYSLDQSNVGSDYTVGISQYFPEGQYIITILPGGGSWSAWSEDNDSADNLGWTWSLNVHDENFSSTDPTSEWPLDEPVISGDYYDDPEDAATLNVGDSILINHLGGDIWFFVWDTYPIDNIYYDGQSLGSLNLIFSVELVPNPVPEPSTMLLLGSGLVGLLGLRRKFRK